MKHRQWLGIVTLPFVYLFAELVWRLCGPKWCRTPERASLAWNPESLRRAGL
jgi:hypothetical protein